MKKIIISILLTVYLAFVGARAIAQVPQVITTICGIGHHGYSGDGGMATAASMVDPTCIATDINGNIYIVDHWSIIRKINTSGVITRIAGTGSTLGPPGDGGPATAARIEDVRGIAVDKTGNVFISSGTGRVRKISTSGIISTFAGGGTGLGDGVPATAAYLSDPRGLAIDRNGNFYVATPMRIRKIDTGGTISTVAGNGTTGFSGDGGPATAAQLWNANSIALDASDNLYISDKTTIRIRKVDSAGIINTLIIDSVESIAIDRYDNLYYSREDSNIVIKVKLHPTLSVGRMAGSGSLLDPLGDGCAATAGCLLIPWGIATDTACNLFIVDYLHSLIRKVGWPAHFYNGPRQYLTVCTGVADSLSSLLAVTDSNIGQVETWSVVNAPLHGTLVSAFTDTARGATMLPRGLYYISTSGFTGNDTFRVRISDCVTSDTTTIYVNVINSPSAIAIQGVNSICQGTNTILTDTITGGTWTSGNPSIATIGSHTGLVTGLTAGAVTITYSVSMSCGSAVAYKTITINPTPAVITGTRVVCAGSSTTLASTTTGGVWSSGLTTVATVGSGTGTVAGVAAGRSTISYIMGTGCMANAVVTVNPLPAAITGVSAICMGASATLATTTTGGLWSSGSMGIATIGSVSGTVTPVSAGTTSITYTLPTGCLTRYALTINALPAAIVGPASVCEGAGITLTNTTSGGLWSAANANATIGSLTGVVTGVTAGADTIRYTLTTGCGVTKAITVNPLPGVIIGATNICAGSSATLTTGSTGGVWSSSNTGIAAIGSLTGTVTGIAAGTATISYTLPTGCYVVKGVTIDPLPAAITGAGAICTGSSATLTTVSTGGVWSSSYSAIAGVGSATGVVTGMAAGTATIIYTLPTGCTASKNITVNPIPGTISGVMVVCSGNTTTLSNGVSGGTWSSLSGIVTVGSAAGDVMGISAGTAAITYTLPAGCFTTATVTVNITPAITGTTFMCLGSTTVLSAAPGGGVWSSSDSSTAAIRSVGVVTGMAYGIADITYTLSTGCYADVFVTVNPAPTVISGTATVCPGGIRTLTDGVPGGVWSSGATGIATIIPSTGDYTGVAAGTALMSYTTGAGCYATYPITVNPAPAGITGTLRVCVGSSTTLLNSTTGGTWSSSNTSIAYIGSTTGLAVGGVQGTVTITYTLPTGCYTTALFTVNPNPGSISGSGTVCRGSSTTLTSSPAGGTWSSNNTAIATIGSASGSMTGVAAGNTTISYTLPTGCYSIKNVTVNPLPSVITGPSTVCTGAGITLRDSIAGGSWSRSNSNISVGITTGSVTGLAAGTSVVTYTLPTGCYVTKTVTVTGSAGTISGTNHLCVGGTTSLTITPATTGVWSSSNTAAATIGSATGTVNAIAPGNTNITFTALSGCSSVMAFTVNPLPVVFTVTGGGAYCAGSTGLHVGLSGSVTGVNYQLYMGGVPTGPTVAGTGGVLDFGLQTAAGTYTITATTAAGCTATMTGSAVIVINPLPSPISGASAVCAGSSATLTTGSTGGTWSSGTTTTGTIGAVSGVFSGIAIGTTIITYTLTTGCYATRIETVSTAPTAIVGASVVCNGASITLTDGVTGGLWYASGAASVGSTTGVVTGTSTGPAIITYTLGTVCTVTKSITVNPSPAAITGTLSLCAGRTTTLGDATIGGTWGGGTTGIATIGTGTGLVTATGAGTTTVSYTVSGCAATAVVTVNAIPVDVSTITTLCVGSTATLAMTPGGGVWSSAATNVSVNSTTGAVAGIATGAATITYTSGTCQTTRTITVISTPVISGVSGLCVGSSAVLTTGAIGGSWTSSNTAIVTIISTSGVMTGMAAGNATITYTAGGCTGTRNVTVSAGPAPITGASSVCVGSTITLSTTTGGGTWTSSNTSIARVGSLTGTVAGVTAGSVNITYSLGSGCVVWWPMTVNATPGAIGGIMSVCVSGTSLLTATGGAGVWSSGNTGIATIGSSTGLFTGVGAGTTTISYTIGTLPGCSATATVTVNTPPSSITGPSSICMGSSAGLTTASTGGTWSSSNTIIATIGSLTGVVNGVNTGFAVITYSLGADCIATKIVTVNLPPPGISGASRVCVGSSTTLTDPASGGMWSSSNTAIANVGSLSGVVSGVSGGVVTISYQVSEGCVATYPVTVNAVPAITGLRSLCAWGDTVTIHDADGTGIYSSTLVTVANLGGGNARVTSSVPGSGTITYTLSSGCTASAPVTVNPIPGAITGSYNICVGSAVTLSSSPGGGNWSSGATGILTVGSVSGLVSGISAGTARITYTLPTGCKTDTTIRVNTLPAGITGWGSVITVGTSSTYSDATPGGIWTTSNPAIATIGMTTGTVYGVAPGVVTISYTVGTSCAATRVLTVQVLPGTGSKG